MTSTNIETVYRKLNELANKHKLSGDSIVTLTCEYGDDCLHYTDDYKSEIFEYSDFSSQLSSLLIELPIEHLTEVYDLHVEEFPVESSPDEYLWEINDSIFTIDEIIETKSEFPLYDDSTNNIHEIAKPRFEEEQLTELIRENMYELCDTLSWNLDRYDHKRGYSTVTMTVEMTIDEAMNLPPYTLSGWSASIETSDGTLTFE
jgi:hypothetical protein